MFQIFPPVFSFLSLLFCPSSICSAPWSKQHVWQLEVGLQGLRVSRRGCTYKARAGPHQQSVHSNRLPKKKKKTEKVLHKFWTVWCFGECVFSDVFIGLLCMYTFLREHACFIQTFPSGALVMSKQTKKISKTIMLPKRGLSIDFKLTSFRPKLHPTVIRSWHKKSEMFFLCIYLYQGQIVHRIV